MIMLLSVPLAILVAIASYCGVFIAGTYGREVSLLAVQGIGQDAVNLFLVVPVLLISTYMAKGSKKALMVWFGAIIYIAYSYVIYAFGIHFNQLFLLYCAILGLSFYSLIYFLLSRVKEPADQWFSDKAPVKSTSLFLFVIAVLFYFIWLSEVIPALLSNAIPKSTLELGVITNPVHVIDIALCLPALMIAAVLLWKKKPLGFLLAPGLLIFCVLMALAIAAMVAAMLLQGLPADLSLAVIFVIISLISMIVLWLFLRQMKEVKQP